jgi:acetylornithine deacetylase/succinyl-diaminopimelate desuccinylase-like protein
MGFDTSIHSNSLPAGGPILVAQRIEDEALPAVLSYGHGDVVVGMATEWAEDRDPYVLEDGDDRYFGRGTADNKGQHLINMLSLQNVIAKQNGKLGYNAKFLIEKSEEIGSLGLREFAEENGELLASDVLIACDGPRVAVDVPTICLGHRCVTNFSLELSLRSEALHSGSWGGFIADPAVILAHAIACISTKDGQLNVPEWRPKSLDPAMSKALEGCPFDSGDATDVPDEYWGEPGLTFWGRTHCGRASRFWPLTMATPFIL